MSIPTIAYFRPREDDMFQITFNQDDDFGDRNKRYWTFKVVESIGIGPLGEHVWGVVTRPWDKKGVHMSTMIQRSLHYATTCLRCKHLSELKQMPGTYVA